MKIFFLSFLIIFSLEIKSQPLVSSTWLSKNLCDNNIKLIEVGSSYNSYLVEHIKCSQFTNFYKNGWRKNINGIAMQLPKIDSLVSIIEGMCISEKDHVILYPKKVTDYYAMAETTAIYFTFKLLGHKRISILNGGYPDFKKQFSLFTEEGNFKLGAAYGYKVNFDESILANTNDVLFNKNNGFPLVDSREKDFYLGINKLKAFKKFGTIKNSINIPSKWFLASRGLKFNNIELINYIFDQSGIDSKENVIFFCYSGLESSINWFVFHELMQKKSSKLFEGSIFEWEAKNKPIYKKF